MAQDNTDQLQPSQTFLPAVATVFSTPKTMTVIGVSGHFGYNDTMKSITDILQRFQWENAYLQNRFHIEELGIFGSGSRGEA